MRKSAGRYSDPSAVSSAISSHSSGIRVSNSLLSKMSSGSAFGGSGTVESMPTSARSSARSCSAKSRFCRSMTMRRGTSPGAGLNGTRTFGSSALDGDETAAAFAASCSLRSAP